MAMIGFFSAVADKIADGLTSVTDAAVPIRAIGQEDYAAAPLDFLTAAQQAWLDTTGWRAKAGQYALLPGKGGLETVLFIKATDADHGHFLQLGALAAGLPEGTYRFENPSMLTEDGLLAWLLGAYSFRQYVTKERHKGRKLAIPATMLSTSAAAKAQAIWFARDLINLPANDLGPSGLMAALTDVGESYGAAVSVISGEELLTQNFPLIHAVGRASDRPPCLGDLVWGEAHHPKVTVVGKGICFDTGGLNIKPPQAMAAMKKDMAGAASAIALAAMIMAERLPVRLRVLIPAADNNISANAFRPGDIITSRAGVTVEISNTDAEGRLVLADALALADEEEPDLLVDFATLTGAARVALGPDIVPFYTDDDTLASRLGGTGTRVSDPVWRLPLWTPYDGYLKSKVADVNHAYNGPFAGSITAALFLRRFVSRARSYAHLDIYGWTPRALPGHPAGGEPQGARAFFEVIRDLYGSAGR